MLKQLKCLMYRFFWEDMLRLHDEKDALRAERDRWIATCKNHEYQILTLKAQLVQLDEKRIRDNESRKARRERSKQTTKPTKGD